MDSVRYRTSANFVQARHGFTLIELMVAIAVLAILLAIAVPSFYNVLLGSKLGGYANELVGSVNVARSEAIKRNAQITLCVSSNGTSCTTGGWESGWLVLNAATGEIILRQPAATSGIQITDTLTGAISIAFTPTGVGATQATLRVCRATPSVGPQERVVTISATGRAWVDRTTNGVCS
jgi:type IV fimbrial biogenesis protein FimT